MRCVAFFLRGAPWLVVVPLLAVVAMPVVTLFSCMTVLLRSLNLPVFGPSGPKKDIRFIAAKRGEVRRCQSPKPEGARKRARRASFAPRGAAQAGLTEGAELSLEFARKRMSKTKPAEGCTEWTWYVGKGRCGEGKAPLGWVVQDASTIGGWNEGRAEHPSLPSGSFVFRQYKLFRDLSHVSKIETWDHTP